MRRSVFSLVLAGAVVSAAPVLAQGGDPLSAATKSTYEMVRGYILKAADQMSEEDYAFKPTPEVRSFGALIGHIANANYMICSRAAGEKSPSADDIEKTKTTKADLVKALGESFAYCDKAYGSMTDAKGVEVVDFFRQKQPRLAVLAFNTSHDFEHYGNIVTYMRLKGKVPPSSQGSN
jgi:uncharacterized damage-inducible protein DinB